MKVYRPTTEGLNTAPRQAQRAQTPPPPRVPRAQSRMDRDFADRGPRLPENAPTAALPTPEKWSVAESCGWYAHAPVWWVRRIAPSQRARDTDAVHNFLVEHKVVGQYRCLKPVIPAYLIKLNIKKAFWWISEAQIKALSDWTVSETNIFPPAKRSTEELKLSIHQKLYNK
jgi:hypothetical protein